MEVTILSLRSPTTETEIIKRLSTKTLNRWSISKSSNLRSENWSVNLLILRLFVNLSKISFVIETKNPIWHETKK